MLSHGRSIAGSFQASLVKAARFSSTNGFAGERTKYKGQLSEMRKVWMEEFARRNELKQQQQQEEKRRIVQEKAVRMREKRKAALVRQELDRKAKAEALVRFRNNLARKHLKWDKRFETQQFRYKRLVEDLERESAVWITKDNVDSKITTDLFDKPATTGFHTRYSNHWRYNAISYNHELARAMQPEQFIPSAASTRTSRLASAFGQQEFYKRQDIEEFLSPLVSTGEERARLPELVEEYLRNMRALEDPDEARMHDKVDLAHELDSMRLAVVAQGDDDNEHENSRGSLHTDRMLQADWHEKHQAFEQIVGDSEADSDEEYEEYSDDFDEGSSDEEALEEEIEEHRQQSDSEGEEGAFDSDEELTARIATRYDERFPEDPAREREPIVLLRRGAEPLKVFAEDVNWVYAKQAYGVSSMHELRRAWYVGRRRFGVDMLRNDAELNTLLEASEGEDSGSGSDSDSYLHSDSDGEEERSLRKNHKLSSDADTDSDGLETGDSSGSGSDREIYSDVDDSEFSMNSDEDEDEGRTRARKWETEDFSSGSDESDYDSDEGSAVARRDLLEFKKFSRSTGAKVADKELIKTAAVDELLQLLDARAESDDHVSPVYKKVSGPARDTESGGDYEDGDEDEYDSNGEEIPMSRVRKLEHVAMKPEEFFDAWELSDDKLATSAKKDKDSKGPHDA